MRKGEVRIGEKRVGTISEVDTGYQFAYDGEYLSLSSAEPVSLTLPLRDEAKEKTSVFSFCLYNLLKNNIFRLLRGKGNK